MYRSRLAVRRLTIGEQDGTGNYPTGCSDIVFHAPDALSAGFYFLQLYRIVIKTGIVQFH
jgi:hypothetical protein